MKIKFLSVESNKSSKSSKTEFYQQILLKDNDKNCKI